MYIFVGSSHVTIHSHVKVSELAHPSLETFLVLRPTCSLSSLLHGSTAIIFLSWYNDVEVTIQLPQMPVSSFVPSSHTDPSITTRFPSEKRYSGTWFRWEATKDNVTLVSMTLSLAGLGSQEVQMWLMFRAKLLLVLGKNEFINICLKTNAQLYSAS